MGSISIFSGVRVTRSLVLCVCFVDRCLSFYTFSFGHCVVCPSIYRFWLPLWYLQTLLITSYFSQHSVLLAKMHISKIWAFLMITRIEILFNVCICYNIIIIIFKVSAKIHNWTLPHAIFGGYKLIHSGLHTSKHHTNRSSWKQDTVL